MSDNKRYFISYSDYTKPSIVELLNEIGASSVNSLPNMPGFVIATLNDSQVESLMQYDKINSVETEPEIEPTVFYSVLDAPVPLTPESFFTGRITSQTQVLSPAHIFHAETTPDSIKGRFGLGNQDESDFERIDYTTYYTGKNVDIVVLDVYDSNPTSSQNVLYSGFDNNPDMADEFGNTRVRNIDWSLFGLERPWNVQQTVDSAKWTKHSMQVASSAAGRMAGFAKDANVYVLHLDGRGEVDTTIEALEAILQWAQQRPINEETGRVNDLLCVNSWGSVTRQYYVQCDAIESVHSATDDILSVRNPERESWRIDEEGEAPKWDVDTFASFKAIPKWANISDDPAEQGVVTSDSTNIAPVVRGIPEVSLPSDSLISIYTTAFQNLVVSGYIVLKSAGNDAGVYSYNKLHSDPQKAASGLSYFKVNDPTGTKNQRWEATASRQTIYSWPGVTEQIQTYADDTKIFPTHPPYDGGIEGVVYVAAMFPSNSNKRLSSFSARGPMVDLYAQGEDNLVFTTENDENKFYFANGTSFSNPLVAGIVACNIEFLRAQAADVNVLTVVSQLKTTSASHINLSARAQNYAAMETFLSTAQLTNTWSLTNTEALAALSIHPNFRDRSLDPVLDASQGMAAFSNDVRLIVPPQILDELSQVEELTPKAAEEPAPVPKIFFGLNINNSLSEVQSESKALENLDLNIKDLDVIRGIRDLGVSREDFQTISGLSFDVSRELFAVKASYDYAFNSTVTDLRYPYNEFSISIDGPLSARGYKYKYIDTNNVLKIADVSTSRISSWSSFDDTDLATPIYYGGDLEVIKNPSSQKSTVTASKLSITSEPEPKRYASEIPTDIITVNIDGVDREVYAMRGIPLTFEGIFRRAFAGAIGHKIVKRVESDPLPTWTIQNNEDRKLFEFEDLDEEDFIQFFDFRTKPRTIKFYYNPSQIEEISIAGIRMREMPDVSLNNLKKLNIQNNDFLTLPNISFIAPAVEDLNISTNNVMRARNFVDAKTILSNLPTTIKKLDASTTIFTNSAPAKETIDEIAGTMFVEAPDFSYLPNLESLNFNAGAINDVKLKIANGKVLPNVYSNYADTPIIRLDAAVKGVPYRIVERRGFTAGDYSRVISIVDLVSQGTEGDKIMFAEDPAINDKLVGIPVDRLPLLQEVKNENNLKEYIVTGHSDDAFSDPWQFLPSAVLDSVNLEVLEINQSGVITDIPYELYNEGGDNTAITDIIKNRLDVQPYDPEELGLTARNIPIIVSKKLKRLQSLKNKHNFINVAGCTDLEYYDITCDSEDRFKSSHEPSGPDGPKYFWGHKLTELFSPLTSEGHNGTVPIEGYSGSPVSVAKDFALDIVKPWEGCTSLETIILTGTYCSLNLLSGLTNLTNVKFLELTDIAMWNKFANSSFNGSFQLERVALSSYTMGGADTTNYPAPIDSTTFDINTFKVLPRLRYLEIAPGGPSVAYNQLAAVGDIDQIPSDVNPAFNITSADVDEGLGIRGWGYLNTDTELPEPVFEYSDPYNRDPVGLNGTNKFRNNELVQYKSNGNSPLPGLIDKHLYYLHYLNDWNGFDKTQPTYFTVSKTMYGSPITPPTPEQVQGTHSFINVREDPKDRGTFRATGIVGSLPTFAFNNRLQELFIHNTSLTEGVTDFEDNETLTTIELSRNLFSQPIPQFTSSVLENLDLSNNNFYASKAFPMPILTCRRLQTLQLNSNCLAGRIPSFAGCPSLTLIDLSNNSFDDYSYLGLSSCTQITEIDLSDNNLTRQNMRQIVKDLYATYNANPRKFVKVNLSGNNVSLNEILADSVANKYYSVLTKIASWSIVI